MQEKTTVFVDAGALRNPRTGTGRMTAAIIERLVEDSRFEVVAVCQNAQIARHVPAGQRIVDTGFLATVLPALIWSKFRLSTLLPSVSDGVFISPITILPKKLPTQVYSVLVANDIVHVINPRSQTLGTCIFYKTFYSGDIRRVNLLVAISEGTSERLFRLYGKKADCLLRPPVVVKQNVSQFELVGLPLKFFLFVGTVEPRKNLVNLLGAFQSLRSHGEFSEFSLVIVGKYGWGQRRVRKTLESLGWVYWLTDITDERIGELYRRSHAVVLVSSYEGFGMPAAEASAFGQRFLGSDIPEIREAARERGVFVTPDFEGIAKGLLEVRDLAPPLPLDDYRFNDDINALILRLNKKDIDLA